MSKFLLKKLVLVSTSEGKGRTITFHPRTTIITGSNGTGKSSIIKSIFRAFGAEPPICKEWINARVAILLSFSINEDEFFILRQGQIFTVFDSQRNVLGQFQSITNELGPFLAKYLNFGLRLQSSTDKQSKLPPPAYYFLPYYFDQDKSWKECWSSFEKLQQMTKWKSDLVEYHTGIKPNKFYELKGEQLELEKKKNQTEADLDVVKRVRDELSDKLQCLPFAIDLDVFREEITQLIIECEKIQKTADNVRDRLVSLHNERISLEAQIGIVKGSLSEINKDYVFLQREGNHVTCPICSATYENGFSEIFDYALDEDKCEDLLGRLNDDLWEVRKKIDGESKKHFEHEGEIAKVRALLTKKREQFELQDLIESESKKQLKGVLAEKIRILNEAIIELAGKLSLLKRDLKQLTSLQRRKEITDYFGQYVASFRHRLDVLPLSERSRGKVLIKIAEQGSDLPRALLAYGFGILQTVRKYTSCVFAPVVIDSPIQQEQDTEHHVKILEFIRDERPADAQLIVGVVDCKDVDFGGKVIHLDNPERSVLLTDEYEPSKLEIEEFLQKSLIFIDRRPV